MTHYTLDDALTAARAAAAEMGGPYAVYRRTHGVTPAFLIVPAWPGAAVQFPGGAPIWRYVETVTP